MQDLTTSLLTEDPSERGDDTIRADCEAIDIDTYRENLPSTDSIALAQSVCYPEGKRRAHKRERIRLACEFIRHGQHGRFYSQLLSNQVSSVVTPSAKNTSTASVLDIFKSEQLQVEEDGLSSSHRDSTTRSLTDKELVTAFGFYSRYHSTIYVNIFYIVAWVHILLALFEPPASILPSQNYLCTRITVAIEYGILLFYSYDFYLYFNCYPWRRLLKNKWSGIRFCVCLIITCDLLLFTVTNFSTVRFSRVFRPFCLITRTRTVRKVFASVFVIFWNLIPMIVITVGVAVFYAVIGYLLFSTTDISTFSTPLNGFLQLFTLILSYSPIMALDEDYFSYSPLVCLFFVSFVIVNTYFLLKLVIAISFRTYKSHAKLKLTKRIRTKKLALLYAFSMIAKRPKQDQHELHTTPDFSESVFPTINTIATTGYIKLSTWLRMLSILRPSLNKDIGTLLFASLDMNKDQKLEFTHFIHLVMLTNVHVTASGTPFQFRNPMWMSFIHLLRRFYSIKYQLPVSFAIPLPIGTYVRILFICLSAVQLSLVAPLPDTKDAKDDVFFWFGFVLLIYFFVDIVFRYLVMGWSEFWEDKWNQLDFFCTLVGALAYTLRFLTFAFQEDDHVFLTIFHLSLLLRFLRVLHLLNLSTATEDIICTMSYVLPIISRFILISLLLLYMFATIGMELYGSTLTTSNPILSNSEWYNSGFGNQLNFSNLAVSLLALFHLMNLASWTMVLDAALELHIPSAVTYIYFVTFRIAFTMFFVPLFAGAIVEAFVKSFNLVTEEKSKEREKDRERQERYEAVQKARRKLEKSGQSHVMNHNTVSNASSSDKPAFLSHTAHTSINSATDAISHTAPTCLLTTRTAETSDITPTPPSSRPMNLAHLRQKSLFHKSYVIKRPYGTSQSKLPHPRSFPQIGKREGKDNSEGEGEGEDDDDDDDEDDDDDVDSNTDSSKYSSPFGYSSTPPTYDSPDTSVMPYANFPSPSQMRIRFTLERRNSETNANILDASDLLHSSFQDDGSTENNIRKRSSIISKRFTPPNFSGSGFHKGVTIDPTPSQFPQLTVVATNPHQASEFVSMLPITEPLSQSMSSAVQRTSTESLYPSVASLIEPTSADYRQEECNDSGTTQSLVDENGKVYLTVDNYISQNSHSNNDSPHHRDGFAPNIVTVASPEVRNVGEGSDEYLAEKRRLQERIIELEQLTATQEKAMQDMSNRLVEREMELRDSILKTGYIPESNLQPTIEF